MSAVRSFRQLKNRQDGNVARPRVTHFGTARISNDIAYDCAVLEDGRRGYVLSTLQPAIVGKITMDWIYEVIFPPEIINEIKTRKKSEKLHQWLEDGGLKLLEKQRDAVMMIARVSSDYRDFDARCSIAFYKHGQQIKLAFQ